MRVACHAGASAERDARDQRQQQRPRQHPPVELHRFKERKRQRAQIAQLGERAPSDRDPRRAAQ